VVGSKCFCKSCDQINTVNMKRLEIQESAEWVSNLHSDSGDRSKPSKPILREIVKKLVWLSYSSSTNY
jgi:hypothetical protein